MLLLLPLLIALIAAELLRSRRPEAHKPALETRARPSRLEDVAAADSATDLVGWVNPLDPSPEYWLIKLIGPEKVQPVFRLTNPSAILGRNERADLAVDVDKVSGQHARIEVADHSVYVTDLASSNGTTINESPLDPHVRYAVSPGDRLAFSTKLVLELKLLGHVAAADRGAPAKPRARPPETIYAPIDSKKETK